ncbi:MAG: dihydroneopterin aldolase [Candidatus Latescibacteria bacterium]|nr:dihydroneopterin aldolase [Candidatus Latescibacterota bacterium]
MNCDKIFIRDLLVRCIIGVNDEERHQKQDVIINITMYADLRNACRSDRIEDTVNYKTVKKRVLAMVEQSSFLLIEKLAGEIAEICLKEPRVQKVKVSVDKPSALRFSRSAAIEIKRSRNDEKQP